MQETIDIKTIIVSSFVNNKKVVEIQSEDNIVFPSIKFLP